MQLLINVPGDQRLYFILLFSDCAYNLNGSVCNVRLGLCDHFLAVIRYKRIEQIIFYDTCCLISNTHDLIFSVR